MLLTVQHRLRDGAILGELRTSQSQTLLHVPASRLRFSGITNTFKLNGDDESELLKTRDSISSVLEKKEVMRFNEADGEALMLH